MVAADNNSVKGKRCIFCNKCSSSKGEHAFPLGVLTRLFPNASDLPRRDSGYWVSRNGKPQQDRQGNPRQHPNIPRDKAPCCEAHNRTLDIRFEQHGQALALKLFSATWANGRPRLNPGPGGELVISEGERELLGLWALKTMLLLRHPETLRTDAPNSPGWFEPPTSFYSWMVNGDSPPEGLSVWCSASEAVQESPDLPINVLRGKHEIAGLSFRIASLENDRVLDAPTCRLWPAPAEDLRMADLFQPTALWPTFRPYDGGVVRM